MNPETPLTGVALSFIVLMNDAGDRSFYTGGVEQPAQPRLLPL